MPEKARILAGMKRFAAPYTCAVFGYRPDDTADPPGQLQGTGSFVRLAGRNLVLTCHHVEREATTGGQHLVVAGVGEGQGLRLDSPFSTAKLPIDAAAAAIEPEDWIRNFPNALAVPQASLAATHTPEHEEALCIFGVPGDEAKALYGQHVGRGLSALLVECAPPAGLTRAVRAFNPKYHFCMPYSPATLTAVPGSRVSVLPMPAGLSGSLVWNTRFREVSAQGRLWTPADARVTGLLWGWHSPSGVLLATRIQHVSAFLHGALEALQGSTR